MLNFESLRTQDIIDHRMQLGKEEEWEHGLGSRSFMGLMGLLLGFDFRFRGPIQIVLLDMVTLSWVWGITQGWDRP